MKIEFKSIGLCGSCNKLRILTNKVDKFFTATASTRANATLDGLEKCGEVLFPPPPIISVTITIIMTCFHPHHVQVPKDSMHLLRSAKPGESDLPWWVICTNIVAHQYFYAPMLLRTNIVLHRGNCRSQTQKGTNHHQRFELALPFKLLTLLTLFTLFTLFTFLHFLPSDKNASTYNTAETALYGYWLLIALWPSEGVRHPWILQ